MVDRDVLIERVACAAVSDAMGSLNIMNPDIKGVFPGAKLAGPAFTVKCFPGSIITVHHAILEAKEGDILVVDDEGDRGGAVFGELMTLECLRRNLGGIVIDGPVRDVDEISRLGFPVFTRSRTPRVGTNRRLGKINLDITCGGVVVRPGDYIYGDGDGVAVIPKERIEEILNAALAIEDKEIDLARRVKDSECLCDLIGLREVIKSQLG